MGLAIRLQVQVLGTIRNISGPTNRRPPNYLPGVKYKHTLSKLGSQVNEARSKRVRVMISTGDVMGDIHAASLVCALQSLSKDLSDGRELEVVALAGERVEAAGATLLGDNTGLSSIGLMEALPLVVPSLQLQKRVRDALRENPPDVAVLIDYPGVNIPFGKYLKQELGCKIVYYIPPNEWLWNPARTASICAMSDLVLCNYRSEQQYFEAAGANAQLVGHPLVDLTAAAPSRSAARRSLGVAERDCVALLIPASRFQEIRHVWPVLAHAARILQEDRPDVRFRFIVPLAAPHLRAAMDHAIEASGLSNVRVWEGDTYTALAAADIALTKSGSVNLELALLGVPQVVVYRIDALTAWIARRVFKFNLPHISLCNLILGRAAVPEFVQEAATPQAVAAASASILSNTNGDDRERMLQEYQSLRETLGSPGVAHRVAGLVLDAVKCS